MPTCIQALRDRAEPHFVFTTAKFIAHRRSEHFHNKTGTAGLRTLLSKYVFSQGLFSCYGERFQIARLCHNCQLSGKATRCPQSIRYCGGIGHASSQVQYAKPLVYFESALLVSIASPTSCVVQLCLIHSVARAVYRSCRCRVRFSASDRRYTMIRKV